MYSYKLKSKHSKKPYFNDLIYLGYSIKQIETIFKSRLDDDLNTKCAAKKTKELIKPPYCFNYEQLSRILSEPDGFSNIDEIIKHMPKLNKYKVDLFMIVEAACLPKTLRPIEGMVFYLSILKEKSPQLDYLKPLVFQHVHRHTLICTQLNVLGESALVERIIVWEKEKSEVDYPCLKKRRLSNFEHPSTINTNLTNPPAFIEQLAPSVQDSLHHFFKTNTQPIKILKTITTNSLPTSSFQPFTSSEVVEPLLEPTQELTTTPDTNLIVDELLDFNFEAYSDLNELNPFTLSDMELPDMDLWENDEKFPSVK